LLRLYDTDFLAAAYETLLGRPLDVAGLQSYLTALREGLDREFVIYTLATSPEGLGFQSDLDGLPQFLKLQTRLRKSRFAILLRFVYRIRRQRLQTNRIETMIGGLDSRLSRLENAQQSPRGLSGSPLSRRDHQGDAESFIKSPRAREIFQRLTSNEILEG